MGNGFAYLVMALWPLLAIYWYRTKSIQTATLWTILGGFMFLPVRTAIDLPLIPPLGKQSIPVVSALLGCWLIKKQAVSYIEELGGIKWLVILLITLPFITSALNSDAIIVGGTYLKGLSYYDGLSATINKFLLITPFFIGRQFFKTYNDQLALFKLLVAAGLFYSIFMLFEVRMSPQLHTWIYGYFPSSWVQQYRGGGFRPVVFMGHGLWVAFFTAVVSITAIALWKNNSKIRSFPPKAVTGYLLVVLVLCKSIASLAYGLFGLIAITGLKIKTQHRAAFLLVCVAMLYPAMSIMKIFPHQAIINIAESISLERAQSLQFRFDNEEVLLNHARERLFFGWGGWGRNRVYDDETGEDTSITDGKWILTFGTLGLIGFIAEFSLLAISVFRANKAAKLIKDKQQQTLHAAHALLVGFVMIDQLPNASLAPWLWLIVGALLGRSEMIILESKNNNLTTIKQERTNVRKS